MGCEHEDADLGGGNVSPRLPTDDERGALLQYARLEISLDELCRRLEGMLTIDFRPKERRFTSHFLVTEPGIPVEKKFLQHAVDQRNKGTITAPQLSDWAAVLIMNDSYDWEWLDEQDVELLNELALR